MKKFLLTLFIFLCVILAGNTTRAQVKVGYINLDTLVKQMPETKNVDKQVDAFTKPFIDQLLYINKEFTTLPHTPLRIMTNSERNEEAKKLRIAQEKMQKIQDDAIIKVEAKKTELMKPILDKAITAIKTIAAERGITYVIESSKRTRTFVAWDGIDLMVEAKARLGIP